MDGRVSEEAQGAVETSVAVESPMIHQDITRYFGSAVAESLSEEAAEQTDEAETGDEEEVGTPPTAEEKAPEPEPKTVPLAALEAERKKRQDYERRVKELEEAAKAPKEYSDPVTDPDTFRREIKEEILAAEFNRRMTQSQERARKDFSDFEEVGQTFAQLAEKDSNLAQQFFDSYDPARFAYETAKTYLENKLLTDPTHREKVKAEMREEIRAELLKELESDPSIKSKARNRQAVESPNLLKQGGGANVSGPIIHKDFTGYFKK